LSINNNIINKIWSLEKILKWQCFKKNFQYLIDRFKNFNFNKYSISKDNCEDRKNIIVKKKKKKKKINK